MARRNIDIEEVQSFCKKRKKKSFIDKVSTSVKNNLLELKEHYQTGRLKQCSKSALWEYSVKKYKLSVSKSLFTGWLET